MKKITGYKPDEARGGKIVDGILIGPRLKVVQYECEGGFITSDKHEAHEVDRKRALRAALAEAIMLQGQKAYMGKEEFLEILLKSEEAIREVMANQKLNPNFTKKYLKRAIKQEKTGVVPLGVILQGAEA